MAAVSDVAGVPQDQLTDIVSTLNQANVPPTQFVEVVRYVPVTYVQAVPSQPTFAEFVTTETSRGITGDALVTSITRRLQTTYNVTPQLITTEPATSFVVQNDYIPQTTIVPQTTLGTTNPLTLIALPLAVAAVADVAGIPQTQLADLVATLNNANVPVAQEIQVIRYVPVALVANNGQSFVDFVQTQVSQGVTGPALVPVVVQELQTFYPQPQQIVVNAPAPQPVVVDRDFIPRTVVTRVEEFHAHPHGGPPGQLKKQLGLQTGAEVVHGRKPGRQFIPPPMVSSAPPQRIEPKEHGGGRGHGQGRGHKDNVQFVAPPAAQQPVIVQQPAPAPVMVPRGNPGKERGGNEGQGNKGGGKDKGHGKDH